MKKNIAILDYGLGNTFSIKQACENVGLNAIITDDHKEIENSHCIILPGVGAFGVAMEQLHRSGLVEQIKLEAEKGKYIVGICLGMQLFMSSSLEFGFNEGLNIISGKTTKFHFRLNELAKVPHIGWNQIHYQDLNLISSKIFNGINDGEYFYFIHSYYTNPADKGLIMTNTKFGSITYCSSFQKNNIIGFQFHPERSGKNGLRVYHNLSKIL